MASRIPLSLKASNGVTFGRPPSSALRLVALWLDAAAAVRRRLRALVPSAKRRSMGESDAPAGARYRDTEFDELARAFGELITRVKSLEAERERTEVELRRQREALFKSEKLADLGRLTAGVAHELRNAFTVIDARTQVLRRQMAARQITPDELDRYVTSLEQAAERMKRIMHGLSTYAKPSKPELTLLDVRELLTAVEELVESQARYSEVSLAVEVSDNLPLVRGDRSQVLQVLMNLALNAIEAMSGAGGKLVFRARRGMPKAPMNGQVPEPGSLESLVIDVADTGPGISADIIPKIWEPFYTTKAEGTGLGLSIVQALVQEHSGTVTVESWPGLGTTFRLTLPAEAVRAGPLPERSRA